jgi:predicted ATPase
MLTRIEINGFKTFEGFTLDLQPFSAIVGPNASGKSNLFDAIRFLSLLAQFDVRTAMQGLRGQPEELFRRTGAGLSKVMSFAVEVLLDAEGEDAFGQTYAINAQRLRYEIELTLKADLNGQARGVFVSFESCTAIPKLEERGQGLWNSGISYSRRTTSFIEMEGLKGNSPAFVIRQDGLTSDGKTTKRGNPLRLPATEASRTALSTITTAEFRHLYALRSLFTATRFLEINPQAARRPSDRLEEKSLRSDASNLAAVLAHLRDETKTEDRPDGVIADVSIDLASLIPSVRAVKVFNDPNAKEYSFDVVMTDRLQFSARVISDGTLRLLALLAMLNDPKRRGILCFEEPENGVHEGRIGALVELLRDAASKMTEIGDEPLFQVLVNTHSPAVMEALDDLEVVAADLVRVIHVQASHGVIKTRMRTGLRSDSLGLNPETDLNRREVQKLLRTRGNAA